MSARALTTPEVEAWLDNLLEVGLFGGGFVHALGCARVDETGSVPARVVLEVLVEADNCPLLCWLALADDHPRLWQLARVSDLVDSASGLNGAKMVEDARSELDELLSVAPFTTMRPGVEARVSARRAEVDAWCSGERARDALVLWAQVVSIETRIEQWVLDTAVAEMATTGLSEAGVGPVDVLGVGFSSNTLPLTLLQARERANGHAAKLELLDMIEAVPEPARGGRVLLAGEWEGTMGGGILLDLLPAPVRGARDARVLPGELAGLGGRSLAAAWLEPTDPPSVVEVACVLAADGTEPGEALRMARVLEAKGDS